MEHDEAPTVLQTGPERFDVWVGGRRFVAYLAHHTRRGLGLRGAPPVRVATEMVRFLVERDALAGAEIDLGRAAGRFPELADELRARLT